MANFEPRGKRIRARVMVNGQRDSGTFATKREAVAWATQREAELTGRRLPDKTLADALERYGLEVAPTHKGARWEQVRLRKLATYPVAARLLASLEGPDLAAWRDARLKEVRPASVRRELTLLRSVLEAARLDWGWLRVNPLAGVRKPTAPASRKRRISQDEIDRLELAFGLGEGLAADTAMQRTGLAFLLGIESAMRAGEMIGLLPTDVRAKAVTLPRTKNGDQREVPLSKRAREILALLLERGAPTVFDLDPGTRDVLFRRARDAAGIADLHFHDSRAEAIWRLSKKLDVMELARVIGHRDLRSLLIYYAVSADDLADRL